MAANSWYNMLMLRWLSAMLLRRSPLRWATSRERHNVSEHVRVMHLALGVILNVGDIVAVVGDMAVIQFGGSGLKLQRESQVRQRLRRSGVKGDPIAVFLVDRYRTTFGCGLGVCILDHVFLCVRELF
ncbi:hypothetical protein K474DRAFT_1126773 [Panus rudis PR-1116 ss-1]|nr:hypothetical protein K474DRAFT_1126773 [Panus rudis PR-1116 ss-1]